MDENNKKVRIDWSGFFVFIGIIFPTLLIGALIIGNFVGESSWGYVLSHNCISWIVCGLLFFIAILCLVRESKKEKSLKNDIK